MNKKLQGEVLCSVQRDTTIEDSHTKSSGNIEENEVEIMIEPEDQEVCSEIMSSSTYICNVYKALIT